jgi:nucleoid DNA-binding protein
MNTSEIVSILAKKLRISQAAARKLLRERLNEFENELIEQGALDLPGLGAIEIKSTKVRRQYIPGKKSICLIPAHKRLVFRINNLLKARLKKQGP